VSELSPRALAVRFTDPEKYFASETSVYRLLKSLDLITSPASLTGLLGINIDGLPWAKDAPWGFDAVIAICAVVVTVEVRIMKKLKWF